MISLRVESTTSLRADYPVAHSRFLELYGNCGHRGHTDNRSDLPWKLLRSVSLSDTFTHVRMSFLSVSNRCPIKVINAGECQTAGRQKVCLHATLNITLCKPGTFHPGHKFIQKHGEVAGWRLPAIFAKPEPVIVVLAQDAIPYPIPFWRGTHSSSFRDGYATNSS